MAEINYFELGIKHAVKEQIKFAESFHNQMYNQDTKEIDEELGKIYLESEKLKKEISEIDYDSFTAGYYLGEECFRKGMDAGYDSEEEIAIKALAIAKKDGEEAKKAFLEGVKTEIIYGNNITVNLEFEEPKKGSK